MTIDETAKSLFLMKYAKEEIRKGVAIPVAKPVVTVGSYTYDGTPQGPTVTGLDEDHCEVLYGTNTDAGTYTMEIHLINNEQYMWADDNSNHPLYYEYTIDKADQVLTVPSQSITLDTTTPNATFAVSGVQGTLHVTGSDATVITVSNLGSNVTIAGNKSKSGTATVDIWAEATSNYNESEHLTINVTTSMLVIVTWASGSKADLEAMVGQDASGALDLANYWGDGDIRVVTMPAMSGWIPCSSHTQHFIISRDTSLSLTSPLGSGRNTSKFIIYQKFALPTRKPMTGTVNCFSYNMTDTHAWINGIYKNTFVSTIGNIIKQFSCPMSLYSNYKYSAGIMNVYAVVPGTKQIVNQEDKASGQTQLNYYKTSSNRIKYTDSSAAYKTAYITSSPYGVSLGAGDVFYYYIESNGSYTNKTFQSRDYNVFLGGPFMVI